MVGHDLVSCTSQIQTIRCIHPDGRPVVLVDTPGFDDTKMSNMDILTLVADWLLKT
jgi:hypothetical protein